MTYNTNKDSYVQILIAGMKSIYGLFLNQKGRIVQDTIIYKHKEVFYVECDISAQPIILTHMKMFKSNFDTEFYRLESQMGVWALFDPESDENPGEIGLTTDSLIS